MLGKLIKGLFGTEKASAPKASKVEVYEGYRIIAEPRSSQSQWQVAGRIELDRGEETLVHVFIRADVMPSEADAANEMIRKARLMIDQQGETIFGG